MSNYNNFPWLSMTLIEIPWLSRPGIFFSKFHDFPGFPWPVRTLQVTGYNFLVEFSPSSMNLRKVVLKFWRVHRGYRRRKRDLVTSNLHKLCNITGQSHTTRRVVWTCREGISHQNCTTKRGIEIGEELKWDPERTIPCHEEKPFSVKGSWRITGREGNWGSIHDGIGFHFVSSPHIP